jgi:hypothetical protein
MKESILSFTKTHFTLNFETGGGKSNAGHMDAVEQHDDIIYWSNDAKSTQLRKFDA